VKLKERTVGGLHDFLADSILERYAVQGGRAVDLGAGSGALALRLRGLGFEVVAVDLNREEFKADVPLVRLNLNETDFPSSLGDGGFDLVTAVEVIEQLESPTGFLRSVSCLLKPAGIAVITTPNVDNAAFRVRFLLTGKLHMMDEGSPNHISPIFYDLFTRQYLARAGLTMAEHYVYPPGTYKVVRKRYAWAVRLLARVLPGHNLFGDIHVFVLRGMMKE